MTRGKRDVEFARLTDLIRRRSIFRRQGLPGHRRFLISSWGTLALPNHRPKKSKTELRGERHVLSTRCELNRYRPEWTKLTAVVEKVAEDRAAQNPTVVGAL